jgi:hypothetical protein
MSSSLVADPSKESRQKSLATQQHAMIVSSNKGLMPSSLSRISSSTWILDSGAAQHMSSDRESFLSLNPTSSITFKIGDGTLTSSTEVVSISTSNFSLSNVYYSPNLTWNLVSVCQLCDSGYSVMFSSTHCYVKDPHSGTLVGKGHRSRDVLDELRIPSTSMPTSSRTTTAFSLPYFVFSFVNIPYFVFSYVNMIFRACFEKWRSQDHSQDHIQDHSKDQSSPS